jgi:hypothetical protein
VGGYPTPSSAPRRHRTCITPDPYEYVPRDTSIDWRDVLQSKKQPNRRSREPRGFTGETKIWEDYPKHFQVIADWNCWDEKEKTDGLFIALNSPADRRKQKGDTYATKGLDIQKLARRVSKGAPELADREGQDYFICALPNNLRVAVAASNATMVNECIDHVNTLCAILDTDEEYGETKEAKWIDKRKETRTEKKSRE